MDENDMQRAQRIAEQLAAAKHEREQADRERAERERRDSE